MRREHAVDFRLHEALEFVPNQSPTQLVLDVRDELGTDLDAPQGTQLGAETLGGAHVGDRSTQPYRWRMPYFGEALECLDNQRVEVEESHCQAPTDRVHESPKARVICRCCAYPTMHESNPSTVQ